MKRPYEYFRERCGKSFEDDKGIRWYIAGAYRGPTVLFKRSDDSEFMVLGVDSLTINQFVEVEKPKPLEIVKKGQAHE